ncbi:hypothetical protein C8R47DRAFT_1210628 [Mycena vitilis]|nr:hypothetical protein C8R47DRAFT_1210628 [Mycena vitilis]
MSARVHTNPSNRAKSRETLEKKVVFKAILDSPFRVPWYIRRLRLSAPNPLFRPSVPMNLQNTALACTISLLGGVSEYQSVRGQENRKRKQLYKDSAHNKKRKTDADASPGNTDIVLPDAPDAREETSSHIRPPVLSHLVVGINEVTKRLDAQIRALRKTVSLNPNPVPELPPPPPPIKIIVVCRADVDPQVLIAHLPHEVAAFNSCNPSECIKIIPLPKGAEAELAKAMGLRRVAVIAFERDTPGLGAFSSILDSVPTLTAQWLTSPAASAAPAKPQLIPTHVKQLRTTAPKDMKMSKILRAEGKAAARDRKAQRVKITVNPTE